MKEMHMALWYTPSDQIPTVAEAVQRLDFLQRNGETPYSFSFRNKFTPEDAARFSVNEV
jgi:hypothetical protein